MKTIFIVASLSLTLGTAALAALVSLQFLWVYALLTPLVLVGVADMLQTERTIRRNFPIIGNLRYFFEAIRPEIVQYFVEQDTDGRPFTRLQRTLVYQRAKGVRDTIPFGTQLNVYESGYEWLEYSLAPQTPKPEDMRVLVGGADCSKKYSASLLNIAAMSFGSLSRQAVLALNGGAKLGNFAHNTGEGGISPHHREKGGDLIWQIGTGYFGCRDKNGGFDADMFAEKAGMEAVKMIEIKVSQGAKPGHGGILPASKVTPEVAKIRSVPMGQDILSPPAHSAFDSPIGMMHFIQTLREKSGGKPIGFKLAVGRWHEFMAICKAMLKTGIRPDFIAVDGAEGGTGAAPLEMSNFVGTPLVEGLLFVHNTLVGMNLRQDIRIIGSGKVVSAFGIIKLLTLGADMIYSARGMLMAMGCIQALRCNSNECPVGITTQKPSLTAGLLPEKKQVRIYNFHQETLDKFCELLGAAGCSSPSQLQPNFIHRRVNDSLSQTYNQIFQYLKPGVLLDPEFGGVSPSYIREYKKADPHSFRPASVPLAS